MRRGACTPTRWRTAGLQTALDRVHLFEYVSLRDRIGCRGPLCAIAPAVVGRRLAAGRRQELSDPAALLASIGLAARVLLNQSVSSLRVYRSVKGNGHVSPSSNPCARAAWVDADDDPGRTC